MLLLSGAHLPANRRGRKSLPRELQKLQPTSGYEGTHLPFGELTADQSGSLHSRVKEIQITPGVSEASVTDPVGIVDFEACISVPLSRLSFPAWAYCP